MAVEILAPAGGPEQLIAAVRSGADAVYLGTKAFSARRNAKNFGDEELKEAVRYCHGRGVKVHVAVNTLVKDAELRSVYDEIERLAESGAVAVLVQDLGVAAMFRRYLPAMPLHASTQMTIHSLEGVKAAEELGFSRAVLARELSLDEISKICSGAGIEIEVFIHGALCMSVSGQCFLSSVLGQRSGNRGLCAQPCRLDFRSGSRGYALSLKDMSYIQHIRELADAGVRSLKIEGRMKRPEYAAAAVKACREALSGADPDLTNLRAVFSRSGFTDGYFTGKRDQSMFGRRTPEDAAASLEVLGEIASGYRNELPRVPVRMKLKTARGRASSLSVADGSITAETTGSVPDKAAAKGTGYELALASLSKTGGTPFFLEDLEADLDESLFIPKSELNAMRRNALDDLLEARSRITPREPSGPFCEPEKRVRTDVPKLRVRLGNKEQFSEEMRSADGIYLPMGEIDSEAVARFGESLICELPRLTFPMKEKELEKRLAELKGFGVSRVCAGNIGALRLAARMGFCVHGGFGLNIINSESLAECETLGLADAFLSYEVNLKDAAAMGGEVGRGIIGYGYLPLMLFRNCPAKGERGCGDCAGRAELTDRTGARFTITCSGREYSCLHNHIPLYLGDKNVRGVDFALLYFTVESAGECLSVWEKFKRGEPFDGTYTRGLYYKKLL